MRTTTTTLRRIMSGAFAVSATGGVLMLAVTSPGTPSAGAASDPCEASSIARTIGGVAVSTANYLDAHPDTDNTLTAISQQQAGPQSLGALKTYFDANPQAAKDMQALQQPLMNLSARCQLPLTLPQAMGLLQGVQSQAGALPAAQNVAVPGMGPLPGPATLTPR